jgi:hypothetical protein
LALIAGELATGGEIRDNDGRLIVVGPGGVAISGGGGGTSSTVALDAATLAALETISVANLLNPHPVSIATALDISDRTARLLGHVTVDNFPATQAVSGSVNVGNFPATQPVSGTVTGNQGSPNTAANGWPAKVTDGTNTAQVLNAAPGSDTGQSALAVRVVSQLGAGSGGGGSAGTIDAPADNKSPTLAQHVQAFLSCFDGTDWDRLRGDTANGLDVDVTRVQGTVATTVGNFPATQAVSGTVTANAGTGPWPVTDNGGSLTVDGTVGVNNFPASQTVADGGGSLTVDTPQLPGALVGSRLDVNLGAVGAGRGLPIVGSAPAQSTVTWTSATALNTALTYTGLAPYGAVTIGITVPTTVTAGAVTVETSLDGTNWTQAGSVRVDNSLVENVVSLAYWPGTNGTRQYLVSLDALAQVRVRLSTVITGTGNVTVIIAPAQQGVEPFVATRARKVATYTALFKAAARPYLLSNAFTANTRKQFATIHHAATATRTVKIRGVWVAVRANTVASDINAELVRITTAPATGNPQITPTPHDSAFATAEATCLGLPTTAGTEGAMLDDVHYFLGAQTAPTVGPASPLIWAPVYQAALGDDDESMPTLRAGVLEGFAVTLDCNAASTVDGQVRVKFTEENP